MPAGVPVATMAIGGAANAALYAARILALTDDALAQRLDERTARIAARGRSDGPVIRTIGILGGGQLGRMLTLEAKRMGYRVVTLEPFPNSPTGQIADEQLVAAYDDLRAIGELGARSDVVTYEFENIPLESVLALEADRRMVDPNAGVLRITQERILEKTFVRECGIPTADFAPVRDRGRIRGGAARGSAFRPCSRRRWAATTARGSGSCATAPRPKRRWRKRAGDALIWEQLIAFDRELSIIATRDRGRRRRRVPGLGERARSRRARDDDRARARIAPDIAERAHAYARTIATRLGIVGTFCVEFFQAGDDAAGQRDRAARAQQRALLARRHADLAVRAARARDLRLAARRRRSCSRRP